jgi:hypothetical protein
MKKLLFTTVFAGCMAIYLPFTASANADQDHQSAIFDSSRIVLPVTEESIKAASERMAKTGKSIGSLPVHEVVQYPGGPVFHLTFDDIMRDLNRGFDDEENGENRVATIVRAVETLSRNLVGQSQVRPVEVFIDDAPYNVTASVEVPFGCSVTDRPVNPNAWHAIHTGERPNQDVDYDIRLRIEDQSHDGDCTVFGCAELEGSDVLYDYESLALSRLVIGMGMTGAYVARSGVDSDGPLTRLQCRNRFFPDEPDIWSQYQASFVDQNLEPVFAGDGEFLGDYDTELYIPVGDQLIRTFNGTFRGSFWHYDHTDTVGQRLREGNELHGVVLPRDLDPEDRVILRDILGYTVSGDTNVAETCSVGCYDDNLIEDFGKLSGVFFDPEKPGHGYNFVVTDDNRMVVFWYGHDYRGKRIWRISDVRNLEGLGWGETLRFNLRSPFFTYNFNDVQPELSEAGRLEVQFHDCGRFDAVLVPNWGFKEEELYRLTRIGNIPCEL